MDELLRTALDAAEAAAAVHRRYAGRVGMDGAADKGRSDFVSLVDLEAQREATSLIRERHPGHRILAEEDEPGGDARSVGREDDGSPVWIVDPLDGTTNFLHGHPMYASSVAVAVDGRSRAGAVIAPADGERWWAMEGRGAWQGERRIRVSPIRSMASALVGTGFPFKQIPRLDEYLEGFRRVLPATSGIRRGGSAALDLCYLSSGRLDAFWELELSPWDVAAGLVILAEAGGVASRIDGSPVDLEGPGSVLAGNSPELATALGRLVRSGK